MFIHASRFITLINEAGVQKIRRNILALQQTLRAMGPATEEEILDRSMQYWDMYERGPKVSREFDAWTWNDSNHDRQCLRDCGRANPCSHSTITTQC